MAKKIDYSRNPEGALIEDSAVRLSNAFGARVAILCEREGILVSHLETAVGLSKGALNAIVSGKRAGRLTAWIAIIVADAFHVDLGFLLTGRPHDSSLLHFSESDVSSWPRALPRLAKRIPQGTSPKKKPAAPVARKKPPKR